MSGHKKVTTRIVETEVAGVRVRYELSYGDADAYLAHKIGEFMASSITRPAAEMNQRPTYWQQTETTFERTVTGIAPVYVAPVENPDPEEWSA